MKTIKLFCLPFAGGSAGVYRKWSPFLPDFIELCPVELAGRGPRLKEPLYDTLEQAVEDVYEQILPQIGEGPYALFGHSMGSVLVYELAHQLAATGGPQPVQLFFSGRKSPQLPVEHQLHKLSDEAFLQEIVSLGGMAPEVAADRELVRLFLPVLRQDVKILEAYEYQERPERLQAEAAVFYGKQDGMTYADMSRWQALLERRCKIHGFAGGHFFLTERPEETVQIIMETLYFRQMDLLTT